MLILGLGIAGRAVLSTGIGAGFLAQAKLPSFVGIVLLGLFLGMRHSTDPDHVVAVSTIASRERSVGQGALIGMLWGVGHTLTIFLVGSAIILFGLVIPPRVGLSMEFSVALMLIVLGVLNLTGALRWLTERFAPVNSSKTRENSGTAGNTAESSLGRLMQPIRLLPGYPPARHRSGSRPCGFCSGGSIGALDHSKSAVGHSVPVGIRHWNDRWHDADDFGHGHPCRLLEQTLRGRRQVSILDFRNR
jgi:hypothetical protein